MDKMVFSVLRPGDRPTKKQLMEIREAAKHPIVFDEDCPELTDEELAEFAELARKRDALRKKSVLSLRVSPETVQIGKTLGKGWTGIMSRLLDLAVRDPLLLKKAL
ncbi:MAG: BrnA antitoxin family protein [Candidatus Margulisbacteria bacterium]|nr:BrnA antitoxin family protein [Candidatus Margulisiibacteriota bacterium]